MFWYTWINAKRIRSGALKAEAWHHRSDALSSVGALIGIGGALLGVRVMEPVASVVICLCILKVCYDILSDALKKMLDTSCPEEQEAEIRQFITSCEGVERLDLLRTRMFGNTVYVDAEIAVDGSMPLKEAHDIAEKVHDGVEQHFGNIKHIMIHVNPAE